MTEPATRRERRRAEARERSAPRSRRGSGNATPAGLAQRAALPALAVLLLLWPLSCLVDIGGTDLPALPAAVLSATAGAAPTATALALPILTLAARRRDWLALALAVAAGLMPWAFVIPYSWEDQPPAAAGQTPVRVMLVDAHDGQASAHDITAATVANAVDVLVVTELSGRLAHDLTVAGLDRTVSAAWVRIPGQDGVPADPESGMGIWLRTGIALVEGHPVGGMQWPAASCRVRAGTSTFTVITGHVAPPWPADGRRWAEELAVLRRATEHTSGARVVVANLNATPWHADFRRFAASGIRDVADVLGQGPRPTWPTWSLIPLLPLDHIMVAGDVGVDTVHGVVIGGSDHRGLVATLRVPTG